MVFSLRSIYPSVYLSIYPSIYVSVYLALCHCLWLCLDVLLQFLDIILWHKYYKWTWIPSTRNLNTSKCYKHTHTRTIFGFFTNLQSQMNSIKFLLHAKIYICNTHCILCYPDARYQMPYQKLTPNIVNCFPWNGISCNGILFRMAKLNAYTHNENGRVCLNLPHQWHRSAMPKKPPNWALFPWQRPPNHVPATHYHPFNIR